MSWYKVGTVSVTNGNATVTGNGTAWIANAKKGEGFLLQGGSQMYEIISINSDTSMTISPAYLGTTQSGQAYSLPPLKGFLQSAYDALTGAINQFNTYASKALVGRFSDGSSAEPGVRFEDDNDTGMRRVDNNSLALVAGGTDHLILDSNKARGSAVQNTKFDATRDKIMLTGAFGLGETSNGPLMVNIDDPDTPSGFWITNSTTLGVTPHVHGTVLHMSRGSGNATQTFHPTNPDGAIGEVYTRGWLNAAGGWSEWFLSYSRNTVIGNVSQNGGVPTGALIQRGTNANGSFTRFADGTQICSVKELAIADSGSTLWNYPIAFAGGEPVSVVATGSNGITPVVPAIGNAGDNSAVVRLFSGATRVADVVNLMAHGRWF